MSLKKKEKEMNIHLRALVILQEQQNKLRQVRTLSYCHSLLQQLQQRIKWVSESGTNPIYWICFTSNQEENLQGSWDFQPSVRHCLCKADSDGTTFLTSVIWLLQLNPSSLPVRRLWLVQSWSEQLLKIGSAGLLTLDQTSKVGFLQK